ncbi:uncharacterized protein LOC108036284 isoform X1 [Drosophila biarmipes]|uniref:uncharacterized protein LOC108036284 isoform X1 n=1 Tax=Drosophila biarmipes TaxID=125945 RepID=UPI0007E7D958|nr:uncharacterized protein LOC108036284 isoform X1 [Drosophila biarmipes]
MLVATLQPGFVTEGVPPLLDCRAPLNPRRYDEEYLLFVLALSISTQMLLMLYVGFAVLQPSSLRRRQMNEGHRRTFANFIFRRMLRQLDEAFCGQDSCSIPREERLDSCLRSNEKVSLAIQLFRRDALKVLQPGQDLSSDLASDVYYVLDEEEQELDFNGYGCSQTKVEVTEDLLMHLLYPERIDPEA